MDQGYTQSAPPARRDISSNFFVRHAPKLFLLVSFVIAVLIFAGVIVSLTKIIVKPHIVLQDIYCLIFSLLSLSAELRQFGWCRKIVYKWMRFFYALTVYRFRGLFYIFFGLLSLGYHPVMYVAGALAIALGLAMFVLTFFTTFPEYDDPEETQRIEKEKEQFNETELQREEETQHGIGAGGVFQNIGTKLSGLGQDVKKSVAGDSKPTSVPPPAQTAPGATKAEGSANLSETPRLPSAAAAMFGSPESASTTPSKNYPQGGFQGQKPPPPVREEGLTRADDSGEDYVEPSKESQLRRQFNQGMGASNSLSDMK